MFNKAKRDRALNHTPASRRKLGFTAWKLYIVGGILAAVWIVFISLSLAIYSFEYKPSRIEKPQEPSAEDFKKYDFYKKHGFSDEKKLFEVFRDSYESDLKLIRDWEKKNNKSFLTEHPTMKPYPYEDKKIREYNPTSQVYYEDTAERAKLEKRAWGHHDISFSLTIDLQSFRMFVYDYDKQYHMQYIYNVETDGVCIDLNADNEPPRLDRLSVSKYGDPDPLGGRPIYQDYLTPDGKFIKGWEKDNLFVYRYFAPVICGEYYRYYVRQMLAGTYDIFENTLKYKFAAEEWANANSIVVPWNKWEKSEEARIIETEKAEQNKFNYYLYCIGFGILAAWFLCGHKLSIFARPRWFPRVAWAFALPFFAYGVFLGGSFLSLWFAWLTVFTPVLLFSFSTYIAVASEYVKETAWYINLFIIGQKEGAGRFGGIREYIKKDCSEFVKATKPHGAKMEDESVWYLGRSHWSFDYKIGARDIGLKGENHKVLIASSGGGKSLYQLTSVLTMWQGGGVVFDPKGEHWKTVIQHKDGEKYLFDPYGVIDEENKAKGWNPLIEIDPDSITARESIARMCDAIFIDDNVGANSMHFKEMALKAVRGIIAHVRTAYPPHLQNLGTVFDLFMYGYPKGEERPRTQYFETVEEENEAGKTVKVKRAAKHPDGTPVMRDLTEVECFNQLIKDMLKNDAIGGAAKDTGIALERLKENEKSGVMSTAYRALDWINSEAWRPILCSENTIDLSNVKTNEAWINLCIPEQYIAESMLFIRLFFQRALDRVDEFTTPNSTEHNRRTLFLFEECDKFGNEFKSIVDLLNFKRSSKVCGAFVFQNYGQIKSRYKNVDNFLSNSDTIYLSVKAEDVQTVEMISKALGESEYTTGNNHGGAETNKRPVMSPNDVKSALSLGNMFVFPAGGEQRVLYLRKTECFKPFKWTKKRS